MVFSDHRGMDIEEDLKTRRKYMVTEVSNKRALESTVPPLSMAVPFVSLLTCNSWRMKSRNKSEKQEPLTLLGSESTYSVAQGESPTLFSW